MTEIKAEKILREAEETIQNTDLTRMVNIIEKKILEDDYTTMDLAAALLRLSMGDEMEDLIDERMPVRSLDDLDDYGNRGGRNGGRGGRSYKNGGRGGNDMVSLFINIGKNQNVRPGDILGAIAGESGIPGKLVGSIDMYDKYTFVEVPREQADEIVRVMKDAKIKGKSVHMETANRR